MSKNKPIKSMELWQAIKSNKKRKKVVSILVKTDVENAFGL